MAGAEIRFLTSKHPVALPLAFSEVFATVGETGSVVPHFHHLCDC